MATTTPNYGWNVPTSADYVAQGAVAIQTLGDEIDATVFGLPSGALELVSTTVLTASGGLSLTSLSLNTRYKIVFYGSCSADNVNINARFRENTTDKTTGYSGGSAGKSYDGTTQEIGYADQANAFIIRIGISASIYLSQFEMDLIIPTLNIGFLQSNAVTNYGPTFRSLGMVNASMTNCNGITIYPSSGNLTGSISLYKYNV